MCFKNRLPGAQNDFPVGNFPRFCYSLTTPQGWIYLDSLVVNSPGLVTTPWRVYTLGSCLQFRTAKSELNPMSILGMSTATKISFSMKKNSKNTHDTVLFIFFVVHLSLKTGFLLAKYAAVRVHIDYVVQYCTVIYIHKKSPPTSQDVSSRRKFQIHKYWTDPCL
jgi:hypothetical protein